MTDPIVEAAKFLAGHLEYARHQLWADEFFTDVEASLRVLRSTAMDPAPKRYLGPCGAPVISYGDILAELDDARTSRSVPAETTCDGDVYAREGAQRGRCTTCGAEVAADERRAWLDEQVRGWAYTAKEISDAYRINVKTIRSWAARGQLAAHGHDATGVPLHNLGDVLDLAAGDAARREGDRATRARRTAARAADDERLSA